MEIVSQVSEDNLTSPPRGYLIVQEGILDRDDLVWDTKKRQWIPVTASGHRNKVGRDILSVMKRANKDTPIFAKVHESLDFTLPPHHRRLWASERLRAGDAFAVLGEYGYSHWCPWEPGDIWAVPPAGPDNSYVVYIRPVLTGFRLWHLNSMLGEDTNTGGLVDPFKTVTGAQLHIQRLQAVESERGDVDPIYGMVVDSRGFPIILLEPDADIVREEHKREGLPSAVGRIAAAAVIPPKIEMTMAIRDSMPPGYRVMQPLEELLASDLLYEQQMWRRCPVADIGKPVGSHRIALRCLPTTEDTTGLLRKLQSLQQLYEELRRDVDELIREKGE